VTIGPIGGTFSVPACPTISGVNRVVGPASAATLQASAAGWRDGRRPLGNVGGPFRVGTVDGKVVLLFSGWHLRSSSGRLYQLDMSLIPRGGEACPTPAHVPSAAGDVFATTWRASLCDDNGNNCAQAHDGIGCAAVWIKGDRLVETLQLGACTPSVFPGVPASRPPSQNPLLASASPRGIYLLSEGQRARSLVAGTYRIIVSTDPGRSTFHLKGPGIDRKAKAGAVRVSWTVTLRPGTYRYWSDSAPKSLRGSFVVN
jgi:hypothetical protein